MIRLTIVALLFALSSFNMVPPSTYMFIMLRPIPACGGKCNNYEIKEYPLKSAEECKKQQDSCVAKYGATATYFTVGPGQAVIYYKHNKFVTECDCKIQGVYQSTSIAQAKEEMNKIVADEKVKKPKAYHNYEVTGWWPR